MTATIVLALRILLAVALYAFLGWALTILWQELRQQGITLSSQKKPGIHIDAKMESGKELRHHFAQTEITIGRNANCDFSIIDEALSAHHARISYHHTQWWLEDLSSSNGTFLNKDQVTVPTVVMSGEQFKCGNTLFTIRIDAVEENNSPSKQL